MAYTTFTFIYGICLPFSPVCFYTRDIFPRGEFKKTKIWSLLVLWGFWLKQLWIRHEDFTTAFVWFETCILPFFFIDTCKKNYQHFKFKLKPQTFFFPTKHAQVHQLIQSNSVYKRSWDVCYRCVSGTGKVEVQDAAAGRCQWGAASAPTAVCLCSSLCIQQRVQMRRSSSVGISAPRGAARTLLEPATPAACFRNVCYVLHGERQQLFCQCLSSNTVPTREKCKKLTDLPC